MPAFWKCFLNTPFAIKAPTMPATKVTTAMMTTIVPFIKLCSSVRYSALTPLEVDISSTYLVRQIVRLDRAGINSVNENRPGHFPFVKVGNKCIYQPGHTSLSTSRFASKDNTLPFFNLQIKILQILPFSTGILKRYMVNINHHHILPYI